MGVFARLFRRSKTTGETAAAETRTDGEKTGTGTDDTAATPGAEAEASADEAEAASEVPVKGSDEAGVTESVDIPKQQSGKAADTEAGEGART
ncbi:hypothetical protein G3I30_03645 [Actinospica acidiphila]|uniref:Gliding motility protein n=1 Tax=Streptomyces tunisiensis TaxID=948699 RepID=A0ABP7XVN7_9ACTN|nr:MULTISPECIES: hypothetical protein [unclassified Streptomyces]AXI89102.1 hypothetical protein SAM9427_27450 [Streptomyces sp. ETH9427]NEA78222.1 hypothetical protein [Actinospica acidiphila]MBQ0975541.1 hypothetical protein [Streptomyces sp. RK31]MBU5946719.1 hypothetical protein [Streptomyces sp. PAM3C]MUT89218.1 hypothetical protein [Streptomyces sp. Z38]